MCTQRQTAEYYRARIYQDRTLEWNRNACSQFGDNSKLNGTTFHTTNTLMKQCTLHAISELFELAWRLHAAFWDHAIKHYNHYKASVFCVSPQHPVTSFGTWLHPNQTPNTIAAGGLPQLAALRAILSCPTSESKMTKMFFLNKKNDNNLLQGSLHSSQSCRKKSSLVRSLTLRLPSCPFLTYIYDIFMYYTISNLDK